MDAQSEKVVKIIKPDRIDRILSRVCSARLEVLVRSKKNKNVAVRGKAELLADNDKPASMTIGGLSDQGIRFLWNCKEVQVEFVGMSTQIVFNTPVISLDGNALKIIKPVELISFDRRANARYTVSERYTSFVRFANWEPNPKDLISPPVLDMFENLSSWIALADISEGGVCAVTRFPGAVDSIPKGITDPHAQLILPMYPPITLPMEVRWTRRIKESKDLGDAVRHQRFFRLGLQFVAPSDEIKLVIKQYINQLSVAEAI